jgi:hypothetical protein
MAAANQARNGFSGDDELDQGRMKSSPKYEKALECADYFRNNRDRMRYPEFHEQGLCTATGVVEAGSKVVVGTRLKRAGMHWDRRRRQRYHRSALFQAQRTLRGFLGTSLRTASRVIPSPKSDVHPGMGNRFARCADF